MIYVWLVAFGSAFFLSLILTPIIRKIARRVGFLDRPGIRKIHSHPVPLGGGVAIFIAVFVPLSIGLSGACFVASSGVTPLWIPPDVLLHLPGVLNKSETLLVIAIGASVIFCMGLVDDRLGLSAWMKLAVQTVVASFLVINGITGSMFMESALLSGILTAIWMVGLMNAFNLMDNMDGLCSGVGAVIAFLFFIVAVMTGQLFIAGLLCLIGGALLGFLPHNTHPARIFLGDAGSQTIGYLFAVTTVISTYYREQYPLHVYALPVIIMSVPIFDTLTVVMIRIREGRSIFKGDTSHFSHRLVALGMTQREAVLFVYLVTLTVGMSAILLYELSLLGAVLVLAQVVFLFTVVYLLERAAGRRMVRME